MELGSAPATAVEMEPSEAAQPHLEAAGSEDASSVSRGAGPQPRRGRTAEVNGCGRLRVSASLADSSGQTDFGLRGRNQKLRSTSKPKHPLVPPPFATAYLRLVTHARHVKT